MRITPRNLSIIFILMLLPLNIVAQRGYSCKVIDAKTKEALAYAKVYASPDNVTMTNYDGEFYLEVQPDDSVKITYIGYESIRIKAKDLPKTIAMNPVSTEMGEVTVKSIYGILIDASKRCEKLFNKYKHRRSLYFSRQHIDRRDSIEMLMEAYISAQNAFNLRHLIFLTGKQAGDTYRHMTTMEIIQAGPMTHQVFTWSNLHLITPLPSNPTIKYYKKNYIIGYRLLKNQQGKRIYHIIFGNRNPPKDPPIVSGDKPVMTGNLYLDAETLLPLMFHGRIEDVLITQGKLNPSYCNVFLHVDFNHNDGYPEVEDVTIIYDLGKTTTHHTMFKVSNEIPKHDHEWPLTKKQRNIVALIDSVGYSPKFWEQNEVYKRTAEEELLLKRYDKLPTAKLQVRALQNINTTHVESKK